jgi:hypothetical protein
VKPTSIVLNWALGTECITPWREQEFKPLITRHVGIAKGDMSQLEGTGALNVLDLDQILVADEGEPIAPRSVIRLPVENELPVFPTFERSLNDAFLRHVNAAGRKWVIITDEADRPRRVLDAHHFLRAVLFDDGTEVKRNRYWHEKPPVDLLEKEWRATPVISGTVPPLREPRRSGGDVH